MHEKEKERWKELAEKVMNEYDPEKFNELVQELHEALEDADQDSTAA